MRLLLAMSLLFLLGAGPARTLAGDETRPGAAQVRRAVDRAVRSRSAAPIWQLVDGAARARIERSVRDVRQLERHDVDDIDAMRLHAMAYAQLVRWVEHLYAAATAPVGDAAAPAHDGHDRLCICDCPRCSDEDCLPCTCVCTGFDESCPWNDEMSGR